ncbi:MAG TPA: ribose 5-phosphate isomerase B [Vicinamibacterales bacterium]|nr:ribose 5-phosphate isomerase B [Vicinamibacterales bacterium]
MRIAIGSDHAGYHLKEALKQTLNGAGVEVEDVGTENEESVDYPDYAERVAARVASGQSDRGILICGTGIGMAMAANKVDGIRAASVTDEIGARLARQHNDANVLALGGRVTPPEVAARLVRIFLDTPFEGGRHQRRVDKVSRLERRQSG